MITGSMVVRARRRFARTGSIGLVIGAFAGCQLTPNRPGDSAAVGGEGGEPNNGAGRGGGTAGSSANSGSSGANTAKGGGGGAGAIGGASGDGSSGDGSSGDDGTGQGGEVGTGGTGGTRATGGSGDDGGAAEGGDAGSTETGGTGAMSGGGTGGKAGSGGTGAGAGATNGGATSGGGGSSGSGGGSAGSGGGNVGPSAGCGKVSPGSGTVSIDVGGTAREYILTLPAGYDPNHAYPVVFAWHPLNSSAEQVANSGGPYGGYYGLRTLADDSVIFVAGQGLPDANDMRGWPNTDGRDIDFLEAMLARLGSDLCVDQGRILSTGFSYGAMMTDLAACQLGQTFRAIASMAGTLTANQSTCVNEPVAAILIHGVDDDVVPPNQGLAFADYLVSVNGCADMNIPADSCATYQGCDAGYPVTWCSFDGEHTIPSFAPQTIWTFFQQFLE